MRFAVIGDYGADTPDELRVSSLVKSWKPDFVVTTGDNNYPDGAATTIDANIGQVLRRLHRQLPRQVRTGKQDQPVLALAPATTTGSAASDRTSSTSPCPATSATTTSTSGSFTSLRSTAIRTNPTGPARDSVQAKWLKDKLGKSKACYDVVYFHHPPYSSARHGSSEYMRWPFREWGAEVVMAGHDHTYERLVVDRIPYFVNGLGGASKYAFRDETLPETQARYNDDYGAMLVDVTKAAITYAFYSADGTKRDSLTLPAPAACAK